MATLTDMIADFNQAAIAVNETASADDWAWYGSYYLGYRKPNYPMPVTIEQADMTTNYRWLCGHCPEPNGPCKVCIDEWIDAIEYWYLD